MVGNPIGSDVDVLPLRGASQKEDRNFSMLDQVIRMSRVGRHSMLSGLIRSGPDEGGVGKTVIVIV